MAELNIAAFLASAIAVRFSETHGQPFVTADQVTYLPFIKHPEPSTEKSQSKYGIRL